MKSTITILLLLALAAGCKKDEIPCYTCTTVLETSYYAHVYDSVVKDVEIVCGAANLPVQGVLDTKFYSNGKAEITRRECVKNK